MSNCDVTIDGEAVEVKTVQVISFKGKTLVEISSLDQLKELVGGEDKAITVDGEPLEDVIDRPVTGTERVTVGQAKGGQGS